MTLNLHAKKILRPIILIIMATFALLSTQAAEISTVMPNPLTTTYLIGGADWFQPNSPSLALDINNGGTLSFVDPAWSPILQQNAPGTTIININTGGIMTFEKASNANGKWLIIGNNRADAIGIINLNGGLLLGANLDRIEVGRAGGKGLININAGFVHFGSDPDIQNGAINFSADSKGILSVTGRDQAYFEKLFTAGKLTHNGSSAGTFTNFFQVVGEAVALHGVIKLPEPPPSIVVNPLTKKVTLSWPSNPSVIYDVAISRDLKTGWDSPTATEISPNGTYTSWTDLTAFGDLCRFYKISERSPGRSGLTAIAADGTLNLDRNAWLARNNLVYNSPPTTKTDSIPLGSGKVGTALWIDPLNGLTVHLNRPEGVPAMAGLGTLRIAQLAAMSSSTNYQGILSIGEGIFTQESEGLTVTSFFRWGGEELVIDVQGADPTETINVELSVYSGGGGHGSIASITSHYAIASYIQANEMTGTDCIAIAGGDGTTSRYPNFRATQFFAARAVGRNIIASSNVSGATLSFNPNLDGSYRVIVPVKIWSGTPIDSTTLKSEALAAVGTVSGLATDSLAALKTTQAANFGATWGTTSIIRLNAVDSGARKEARFIEQMLALDTYLRISASLTPLPAVGGGETRLFSWNAVGLFNLSHWYQNLRPVNYANIASGVWAGNSGTWDWHLGFLPDFKQHVMDTFPGYEGAGYPEYIDGQPGQAGSLLASQNWGTRSISPEGEYWFTSRQMSTTLEVIGGILSEYDYRQDAAFLNTYWPLIREGMLFHRSLLMADGLGEDGLYHYRHLNSRENNWNDDDDTPDVANIRYLLPIVIKFAQQQGDTSLVAKLNDLVGKLPELAIKPRVHPVSGLPVDAIAFSALSRSSGHNAENPDLDAIWPANLIGDASGPHLVQLANDTLDTRVYKESHDWHPTAVQAARMGRTELYKEVLLKGIGRFLAYPQGLQSYDGHSSDIQTEFTSVQTLGAHEALVQNYDGLLRLANAWPAEWEAIAWLPSEGGHQVTVEVIAGESQVAVIDLGSTDPAMRIRNPWPGEIFTIHDLTTDTQLFNGNETIATVAAMSGHRLLIERISQPLDSLSFKPIVDSPNTGPNQLGNRKLGKP